MKMKRLWALLLVGALALSLVACSNTDNGGSGGDGSGQTDAVDDLTLSEVLEKIQKDVELPMVGEMEVTDENFAGYFFIDPIEGAETLVSEAMINAVAHSVCLIRVPEGTDAAQVAADIEKNADPRKWICVEAEKTVVKTRGRTVLLVMSTTDTTDAIVENFDAI